MNITRMLLIGITFIIAAVLTFNFYIWAQEYKDMFAYNGDYISYIMVFVFIMAITGIFKWLLQEEIILTRPRRRRK
jgi:predicted transporter